MALLNIFIPSNFILRHEEMKESMREAGGMELKISTGPSQPVQFCDSAKLTQGKSWKEFVPHAVLHAMEDREKLVQVLDSK